jgi:hypothetical protein
MDSREIILAAAKIISVITGIDVDDIMKFIKNKIEEC